MSELFREAVEAAERAVGGETIEVRDFLERLFAHPEQPRTDDGRVYLSVLLDALGMRDEAVRVLRDDARGEVNALMRNTEGMLAANHGEYDHALVLFAEALRTARRSSPLCGKILANLAAVSWRAGRTDDAIQWTAEASAAQSDGEDPATAVLIASVQAQIAAAQGNVPGLRDAATMLADASRDRIAELGADQPQALVTVANVAAIEVMLASAEQSVERLERGRQVLEIAASRLAAELGADHPQSLVASAHLVASRLYLPAVHDSAARRRQAIDQLTAVSQRIDSTLGAAHPQAQMLSRILSSARLDPDRDQDTISPGRRTEPQTSRPFGPRDTTRGITLYPGARPFTRAEAGRFFGRTAEAARLVGEWLSNPITFLTGPSGIGKTSLLTAGVLPFVENRRSSISLLPIGRLSGPDGTGYNLSSRYPAAALPPHNPYTLSLLQSWSRSSTPAYLARETIDGYLRYYAERHPDVLILAPIDQADDLFAGPDGRYPLRRQFLNELATAVREQPRLRLLISVRSDCLPDFAEVLGDPVQFHLDPLTPAQALAAASGPGYFTRDAASALVQGIRVREVAGKNPMVLTEAIEPALLQIACASVWRSLRAHTSEATLADLGLLGDAPVDAALTSYCGAAIATVAAAHEVAVRWLRDWLIDTFISEDGRPLTVHEEGPTTAGVPTTLVRALQDRYLLRAYAGSRMYRLISGRIAEPLWETTGTSQDSWPTDPADPDQYLREAERARVLGEHDLAHKIATLVLQTVPGTDLRRHAEAQSLLGDVAYEQGEFDKAESYYAKSMNLFEACRQDAAVGRLYAAVARTFIARGQLAEALGQLSAAVNRSSDLTLQDELANVMAELAEAHEPKDAREPRD